MDWKYVGEAGIELKARNSHSMGIVTEQTSALSPPSSSSPHNLTHGDTPHNNTDTVDGTKMKIDKYSKKSYLVIYGGASPEEGPMGDTVYAALPQPDEIGK